MDDFPSVVGGQNLIVFGIVGAVVLLGLVGLGFAFVKWQSARTPEIVSRTTEDTALAHPGEPAVGAQVAPATSNINSETTTCDAYLRLVAAQSETRYPIQATGLRLGAAKDNDLVIDNSFVGWVTVASHHARIEVADGQYILLADSDPAKELRVDGRLSRENLLRDGARIQLGEVVFEFCRSDRGDASQAQGGLP